MADIPKRRYSLPSDRLHADAELGFSRVRSSISALSASDIAYTPVDASQWDAPLPTTLQEALDRLAAAGGTNPVPVL